MKVIERRQSKELAERMKVRGKENVEKENVSEEWCAKSHLEKVRVHEV